MMVGTVNIVKIVEYSWFLFINYGSYFNSIILLKLSFNEESYLYRTSYLLHPLLPSFGLAHSFQHSQVHFQNFDSNYKRRKAFDLSLR